MARALRPVVIAAAVMCPLLWQAASASAQDPIPDPSANRAPSQATNQACFSAPTSQTCANDALADLNAARVSDTVALKSAKPPTLFVKLNHAHIRRGQSAKLTGAVSPAQAGTYVELQQRHGHSWRDLARAELRLSNRFSFTIRGSSKGKYS